MSAALVKKDMDLDSDDEEELELQRKAEADAAPKVEEPEEDTSLANSDVTTKYQEAAKITQAALVEVAAMVRHSIRSRLNHWEVLLTLHFTCTELLWSFNQSSRLW